MSDHAIRRPVTARLGVSLAGILLATLAATAAAPPEPPEPPEPPGHKEISLKGLTILKGETRKGDVIMFAPSVNIEGTLDGDLWVTTSSARISGVVTGDAFIAGSQIEITGEIKKSLRCTGANVVLDGTVAGSVLVAGGTLTIGSNARIMEGASVYTAQMTDHGIISESLVFKGGTAVIGGKVMEDADLTADTIEIEPGARIEGDVTYSTRRKMDAEMKAISGGDVTFDEKRDDKSEREAKHGSESRLFHPTTFSVGKWIAFFVASYLFGCALLAVFKHHEPEIDAAIASDTLRTAGLGFVSVLATIAVCFSAILFVTIPFVVIYLIAYAGAAYLAKIPVAVWLGRRIFRLTGRSTGPFAALFVGLVALYLIFMIPFFIGILAQVAVALVGLGAMVSVYIAQRQARRAAAAVAAATPEAPPAAS